jgi:phosphoglycolate phosphatase-like HAD superfamily hydrolase
MAIFSRTRVCTIYCIGVKLKKFDESGQGEKIDDFFRKIISSKEMDATDKYANIVTLIQKENLCNTSIVIIGDTLSDYYLVENIRCRFVLLSKGYQSKQKLCKVDGVRVVENFVELIELDSMGKLYE